VARPGPRSLQALLTITVHFDVYTEDCGPQQASRTLPTQTSNYPLTVCAAAPLPGLLGEAQLRSRSQ
jgi:hypothetical protein